MKAVWFTLAMLLWQMSPLLAVEYNGKRIDGQTFSAKVYSYETGAVYDAQVQFDHNQVTIQFPGGSQMIGRLQQSVIRNPGQIEVFGSPGRIPLGNVFSIGLSNGFSGDNFANPSSSLSNYWRISIDDLKND